MSTSQYFKYASCPRCGSSSLASLGSSPNYLNIPLKDAYTVSRSKCLRCHFIFLNPRPNSLYLASLYEKWHSTYASDTDHLPEHLRDRHLEFRDKHLAIISKYAPTSSSLLDIGCGNGSFLQVAGAETTMSLTGIDVSHFAINSARQRVPNATLYTGTLLDVSQKLSMYDVISMNDYLEHSSSPFHDLDLVCSTLLAQGGILFIRVPNQGGLLARLMRNTWYAIIPFHLWYFTAPILRQELQLRGMEILYCSAPAFIDYRMYLVGMTQFIIARVKATLFCRLRQATDMSSSRKERSSTEPDHSLTQYRRSLSVFAFILGVIATHIDFLAAFFGSGNDLTVVARKSSPL